MGSMLWRVRASLPDRPGGLADLARECAERGVDIRAVQVFPGVDAVTDELVVETPEGWGAAEVALLVESAGWRHLAALPCTPEALTDQPARYVAAARRILARPQAFPEVVAQLFDALSEPAPAGAPEDQVLDALEVTVGDVQVQVRRAVPFTDVERARGVALAGLVSDVLRRGATAAPPPVVPAGNRRLGVGSVPSYVVDGDVVRAVVDGAVVGLATVHAPVPPGPDDEGAVVRPVTLRVDAAWQRRGIGTRLLGDVCRLAHTIGATDVVLETRADNQAVLPMVLSAGMRGRIRMAGDRLTVRVPVRDLRPLARP